MGIFSKIFGIGIRTNERLARASKAIKKSSPGAARELLQPLLDELDSLSKSSQFNVLRLMGEAYYTEGDNNSAQKFYTRALGAGQDAEVHPDLFMDCEEKTMFCCSSLQMFGEYEVVCTNNFSRRLRRLIAAGATQVAQDDWVELSHFLMSHCLQIETYNSDRIVEFHKVIAGLLRDAASSAEEPLRTQFLEKAEELILDCPRLEEYKAAFENVKDILGDSASPSSPQRTGTDGAAIEKTNDKKPVTRVFPDSGISKDCAKSRLQRLLELRDEGLISEDDYERRKAEILAEL